MSVVSVSKTRTKSETESLKGVVDHILFNNHENFSVFTVRDKDGNVHRVAANIVVIAEGQEVDVRGKWVRHPKYGKQMRAESVLNRFPISRDGLKNCLKSCRGIGENKAKKIVESVSVGDLLKYLNGGDVKSLEKLPGVGPKLAKEMADFWKRHQDIQEVIAFLKQYDISDSLAMRLYKRLGDKVVERLQTNPYLLTEVSGVGFKTADEIATALGITKDAPIRLRSAVLYVLGQAADTEGHCWLPSKELITRTLALTECEAAEIESRALNHLARTGRLAVYDEGYALPWLDRYQKEAASLLTWNGKRPPDIRPLDRAGDLILTPSQKRAVEILCKSRIAVLTGGPGTGKTTTLRVFLESCRKAGVSTALTAPTGKAAKRLSESCRAPAKTIHRLLGARPGGAFLHGRNHPLDCDTLIVDESSMIDVRLFHALVSALKPGARMVLVGDEHQLPSVGPGNVLGDLIASGVVPVARLTEIHRQAEGSPIVKAAHAIHTGRAPRHAITGDGGVAVVTMTKHPKTARRERLLNLVVELVAAHVPKRFGLTPNDVQVLTAMNRGPLGVDNLNAHLQTRLNPTGAWIRYGESVFKAGDPVVQTVNDYHRQVFNGDYGRIESVDEDKGVLTVSFDGNVFEYARNDLSALRLAYATTIHKSQGSEFPAVIVPMDWSQYVMLNRNLFYTAVTRAKSLVVVAAEDERVIHMAVNNVDTRKRWTRLKENLIASFGAHDAQFVEHGAKRVNVKQRRIEQNQTPLFF